MNTPYENLANAIVIQAVKDYRDQILWLKAHGPLDEDDEKDADYIDAIAEKESIERFFLGGWFSMLTDLDGKVLLEKLKCEVV